MVPYFSFNPTEWNVRVVLRAFLGTTNTQQFAPQPLSFSQNTDELSLAIVWSILFVWSDKCFVLKDGSWVTTPNEGGTTASHNSLGIGTTPTGPKPTSSTLSSKIVVRGTRLVESSSKVSHVKGSNENRSRRNKYNTLFGAPSPPFFQ